MPASSAFVLLLTAGTLRLLLLLLLQPPIRSAELSRKFCRSPLTQGSVPGLSPGLGACSVTCRAGLYEVDSEDALGPQLDMVWSLLNSVVRFFPFAYLQSLGLLLTPQPLLRQLPCPPPATDSPCHCAG